MDSTRWIHRCGHAVVLVVAAGLLACPVAWSQTTEQPAEGTPSGQPQSPVAPSSQATQEVTGVEWPPGLAMEGFDKIGLGEPMRKARLQFYGFLQSGFTGCLTGDANPLPGRYFDARRPNNLRLNQLVLTLERTYDKTKTFDAGFRMDGMFGGDAMLTHSLGLFDKAGHGTGECWADVPQLYGQLWFKTGEESGLELTVGKFLTPHGYEATYGVDAPMYSHSYMFSFAEPLAHTGVKANYVITSQASAYFAIVNGWDNFEDNNHAHSYMTGLNLTSKEQIGGQARDQVTLNLMTGPEQDGRVHNYRTLLTGTATHFWTEKLSSGLAADWATEEDVGGFDRANWYGVAHYLSYIFCSRATGTWRSEWFQDDTGVRTGTEGNYLENTFGLAITPWPENRILKNLTIRPEFRWDAAENAAFDGHYNLLTAAVDIIVKF